MTRNVLLDTNLLIAAFDRQGTTSAEMKSLAISQLSVLLEDPEVKLFITPLVRYEVLRGIAWQSADEFMTMKNTLKGFTELDVTRDISELSANLFRFDTWQAQQANDRSRNVDKRKFDVFHYCSAHCNSLEFCSNDTDIGRIRTLHTAYEEALAS
ncbi:PIN domain-containing protein [Pseudescherichia vulneris]|uniref:PIN domain-containing protein n=1 Tax=Pseudescherichia vulneris TaxID=566 RepID=UPI00227AA5FC|nr:PIN domain-containing protein [Pseudescherichia vulneris]WAH50916.1 PIN domain-containing protein [Pseudescherichia vulneris]